MKAEVTVEVTVLVDGVIVTVSVLAERVTVVPPIVMVEGAAHVEVSMLVMVDVMVVVGGGMVGHVELSL